MRFIRTRVTCLEEHRDKEVIDVIKIDHATHCNMLYMLA